MSKNFIPLHNKPTNDKDFSKHPRSSNLSRLQLHTKHHISGLNKYKGRITSAVVVLALLASGPFLYKGYTHNKMELQTKADAVKQINDANKPYLESPVYNKHKNIFYDRLSPQGRKLRDNARQEMLHNYALKKETSANAVKKNSAGYSESTSLKTFQSVRDNVRNQSKALKKKNPSVKVKIKGLTAPKSFLPTRVSHIDWEIANLETKNLAQNDKNLTGKTVSNNSTHTIYAFVKPKVAKDLNVDKYAKRHHVMGKVLKVNSDTTYNKINHSDIPTQLLQNTEKVMKQSDSQGINIVLVAQTPQTKVQRAKAKLANLIAKLKSHFHHHKISGKDIQDVEQRQRNKSNQPLKPDAVHKLSKPKEHQHIDKSHHKTLAIKHSKHARKPYNAFKDNKPLKPIRRRTKATSAPVSYIPNSDASQVTTQKASVPNFLPKAQSTSTTSNYNGYNAVSKLSI